MIVLVQRNAFSLEELEVFRRQLAPEVSYIRLHEQEFIVPVKLAFRCHWEGVFAKMQTTRGEF